MAPSSITLSDVHLDRVCCSGLWITGIASCCRIICRRWCGLRRRESPSYSLRAPWVGSPERSDTRPSEKSYNRVAALGSYIRAAPSWVPDSFPPEI